MMGTKLIQFQIALALMTTPIASSLGNVIYDQNDTSLIRIGRSIPKIIFDNVSNSTSGRFSTDELEKPTILYFFSAVCKASFAHFLEIDEMHSSHKRNVDFIMVGIDLGDNIQDMYQIYSGKYNLKLPITFDKAIYKKYNIRGVPHVIWIDKGGIVQAITNVLDNGYLKQFINGSKFDFISYDPEDRERQRNFDPDEPFLIGGNGGREGDFIQRSLLSEWKIGMPNEMPYAESNKNPLKGLKYLQVIGRGLPDLYRIAYFGKTYAWHPEDFAYGNYHYSLILEIDDKSKFESDYNLGKNLFCYSQILAPQRRNPRQMMAVMQRDLKNFFGYDVAIETRLMSYLGLIARDNARKRLTHRGASMESFASLTYVELIDKPIGDLISLLSYYLDLTVNDLPIIDETGIYNNIDIRFNSIMTDTDEVKRALQEHGLDLVLKKRPMKVIVIRESKS